MNQATPDKSFNEPRPAAIGWGIAVLMVVLAWVGACSMGAGEPVEIEGWVDGLDAGQAQAEASDQPMVVMFTADWCGPCQQFKREVLIQDSVKARLAEGFVPVKIDLTDMSASNPNRAVAERYGVSGVPTLMALTPSGETIGVYRGEWEPAAFNAWLDGVAAD